MSRDSSTGALEYSISVSASGYWNAGEICELPGWGCNVGVEIKDGAGTSGQLTSASIPYPDPSYTKQFDGSVDTGPQEFVRPFVSGHGGTIYGAWVAFSDPFTAPVASVEDISVGRDPSTGFFTYAATASSAAYWSSQGVCAMAGWGCSIGLEVVAGTSGLPGTLDSYNITYPNPSISHGFSGAVDVAPVSAIRAVVTGHGGKVTSDWVSVIDPYVPPGAAIVVDSIGRDRPTGKLTFDLTALSSAYFSSAGVCRRPGFGCNVGIDVRFTNNTEGVLTTATIPYPEPTVAHQFTGNIDVGQVAAVRAFVSGADGKVTSDWVEVVDPYSPPDTGLDITSLSQDPVAGEISFDVKAYAQAYFSGGGVCVYAGFSCVVGVEAQYGPTHSVATLGAYSITWPTPSTAHRFHSTSSLSGVTALRSFITGSNGRRIEGAWIPVSDHVEAGHDVDAALALVVAGVAGSAAPCFSLFEIGTHELGSSESDQQLACTSALSSGQSLRSFLTTLVAAGGASILDQLLVSAGVASSYATQSGFGITVNAQGQVVLPENCTYTGFWLVTCTSGTTVTDVRDPTAPFVSDPVAENNALQQFLENVGVESMPEPGPTPGPIPGPLGWGSKADRAQTYVDLCRQYVNTPAIGPGGSPTTKGGLAGVSSDDCTSMPIFFTGANSPEASQHDKEAIGSHPEWVRLTYASTAEKAAEGKTRKSTWYGSPECPSPVAGFQCDEYPYFTTDQGYPDTLSPSLKSIPKLDNETQGGLLSAFYRCPTFSEAVPHSGGRDFLVIPLPAPLPTLGYCGATS